MEMVGRVGLEPTTNGSRGWRGSAEKELFSFDASQKCTESWVIRMKVLARSFGGVIWSDPLPEPTCHTYQHRRRLGWRPRACRLSRPSHPVASDRETGMAQCHRSLPQRPLPLPRIERIVPDLLTLLVVNHAYRAYRARQLERTV